MNHNAFVSLKFPVSICGLDQLSGSLTPHCKLIAIGKHVLSDICA